ncbi:O-antigen ligase family protein [Indiicoccus explosivorum]|uniref:O-antigen ligase family protein n=1 Tax=Indiicoccus explosivorum TaxID=1917864 RepID=UPI000B44D729|nr:O-antigen ligase family protein [Indiicoccus explosivorum]
MDFKKILILLVAFIALQPIIDVLTAASIFIVETSLTAGVLLRAAYMLAIIALLLWTAVRSKMSRIFVAYLAGLALLLVVNVAVSLQFKEPYYLFQELKFFNKVIYFHIVLLGLLIAYRGLKVRGVDIASITTKYFRWSGLIIGIVFVVAIITGTSLTNYSYRKIGFTGWFYAGNEIGAIMAVVLPILALYAIRHTDSWKKPWAWAPFVLLAFGMLLLGTKVGYGGVLIVLLSVLIGSLIMRYLMRQHTDEVRANLKISAVLTALLLVVTPVTPVFSNVFVHINSLGIDFGGDEQTEGEEEPQEGEEGFEEEPEITGEQVQNLVFSSREKYEAVMREDFLSSPLPQQLFGLGFAGNYEEPEPGKELSMIEMDFHDWFYSFGWIGFIYLILPLVWYAGKYVVHFVKNIRTKFTYFYILYGVAFLLGIGISYTAGHVLTAPAVSIYLAAVLAMLTVHEGLLEGSE